MKSIFPPAILFTIVFLFVSFYSFVVYENSILRRAGVDAEMTSPAVKIGNNIIHVELAVSAEEKQRGLSDRDFLSEDRGMLFVFGESGMHGFWMNRMLFDLDLLWLRDMRVVGITPNVPAPRGESSGDILPVYYPPQPADMVLEINAGFGERLGIRVGDRVSAIGFRQR